MTTTLYHGYRIDYVSTAGYKGRSYVYKTAHLPDDQIGISWAMNAPEGYLQAWSVHYLGQVQCVAVAGPPALRGAGTAGGGYHDEL